MIDLVVRSEQIYVCKYTSSAASDPTLLGWLKVKHDSLLSAAYRLIDIPEVSQYITRRVHIASELRIRVPENVSAIVNLNRTYVRIIEK